jgi:hypothetical protein
LLHSVDGLENTRFNPYLVGAVYESVNELGERYCPSWTGGVAVPGRKNCEATTVGTDGVVVQTRTKYLNHHPVRSLSMLRDFFDVAATPPVQEGQCPVPYFIHTFIDRAHITAS